MQKAARRLLLEVVGWTLVVVGVAALILPGPGLLMLFGGLAVLSQQYDWAEKRLHPVKVKAMQTAEDSVKTVPRILFSSLVALGLIAAGVVWILQPPAPGWWPLPDGWWLVGGLGTGLTQIISGLIALALMVYSYRRFR